MEFLNNPKKKELIKHLPKFMQEYLELKQILEIESEYIFEIKKIARETFANNFMFRTSINGIKLWENMMNISINENLTLENRQSEVYRKWNNNNSYTWLWLKEYLDMYFLSASTVCTPILYNNEYFLKLEFTTDKLTDLELNLPIELRPYIPANLGIGVTRIKENSSNMFLGNFIEKKHKKELFMDSGTQEKNNSIYYATFIERKMEAI